MSRSYLNGFRPKFLANRNSNASLSDVAGNNSFSAANRSSSHPDWFAPNFSLDSDSNTPHFHMARKSFSTNSFPHMSGTNFGSGTDSRFDSQPTIHHHHSLSESQINPTIHDSMLSTHITDADFGGFPQSQFGTYNPPVSALPYVSPYGIESSPPGSSTPPALAVNQTIHGYHEYPQGSNMDQTLLSDHSPSTNYTGVTGKLPAMPELHEDVNRRVESDIGYLGIVNNQQGLDGHTASTDADLPSAMMPFLDDDLFPPNPGPYDPSF